MLRAHSQPTLWGTLLPEMALRMPTVLVAVDELLDDAAYIVPFEAHFHPPMDARRSRSRPICG